MPGQWTPGDILDYELFLDEEIENPSGAEHLRTWFQTYQGRKKSGMILHSWLNHKRGGAKTVLPGKTVDRLFRLTVSLLMILGFLAGSGLGWGILSYAGSNPVNLFLTLILLVGLPFLLTSIALILILIPVGGKRSRRMMDRLMRALKGISGLMDRKHSDALIGAISGIRGRWMIYRHLLRWSFSLIIQLRAFAFHLGVFTAVLWKGIVQDVAFGWQTTLNVNTRDIHRLVSLISRPWAGWFPPPSVEQIAGSRIILKNGITGLENADLTVWWMFICLAVLTYGVLPRLLLFIYSLFRRQLILGLLPFSDGKSRQLLLMMRTPLLDVSGVEPGRDKTLPVPGDVSPGRQLSSGTFHMLIPSSRKDLMSPGFWERVLSRQWGATSGNIIPVSLDDEEDAALPASLEVLKKSGNNGLILVFEGWRPYTAAAALYADYIQSLLPGDSVLYIALAGRPGKWFEIEERDKETFVQWTALLPAALSSGVCEIIRIRDGVDHAGT